MLSLSRINFSELSTLPRRACVVSNLASKFSSLVLLVTACFVRFTTLLIHFLGNCFALLTSSLLKLDFRVYEQLGEVSDRTWVEDVDWERIDFSKLSF